MTRGGPGRGGNGDYLAIGASTDPVGTDEVELAHALLEYVGGGCLAESGGTREDGLLDARWRGRHGGGVVAIAESRSADEQRHCSSHRRTGHARAR